MGTSVTGLAGVIVWTSAARFPAMAAFYRESLGLEPRSERPGFVNFAWGEVRLTVTVHDRVEGPAADPLRVMVNLATDDIDGMHDRLVAAGAPVVRSPEPEPWGGRVATYADPDGNLIQLLALPGT